MPAVPFDLIDARFGSHPPRPETAPTFLRQRAEYAALAQAVADRLPPSREASLALTALEESLMWANKTIAMHGVVELEDRAS